MKSILAILLCAVCGCAAATEKQVRLPNDSGKLYVSIYASTPAQVAKLTATYPQINHYKAGNHVNVYYKSNPMYKARFAHVSVPCAYVQMKNGEVLWTSDRNCILPWRRNHTHPETAPAPDEDEGDEEDSDPSYPVVTLLVALAAAAAVGVGTALRDKFRKK